MDQAIGLPDICGLADCLSEANRRELPRTRDVVCVIVQDQDILQMESKWVSQSIDLLDHEVLSTVGSSE